MGKLSHPTHVTLTSAVVLHNAAHIMQDNNYIEIELKYRWRKKVDVVTNVRRQAFASVLSSLNTHGLVSSSNLNGMK